MQNTPSASATLVTYQPQLLHTPRPNHPLLRSPIGAPEIRGCKGRFSFARVGRLADEPFVVLAVENMGQSVAISLLAGDLRCLAFQLLDAAHDLKHFSARREPSA